MTKLKPVTVTRRCDDTVDQWRHHGLEAAPPHGALLLLERVSLYDSTGLSCVSVVELHVVQDFCSSASQALKI